MKKKMILKTNKKKLLFPLFLTFITLVLVLTGIGVGFFNNKQTGKDNNNEKLQVLKKEKKLEDEKNSADLKKIAKIKAIYRKIQINILEKLEWFQQGENGRWWIHHDENPDYRTKKRLSSLLEEVKNLKEKDYFIVQKGDGELLKKWKANLLEIKEKVVDKLMFIERELTSGPWHIKKISEIKENQAEIEALKIKARRELTS